jgi:hypothetical protein
MTLRAIEIGTGLNPEVLEGCGNICRKCNSLFEIFMKFSVLKFSDISE